MGRKRETWVCWGPRRGFCFYRHGSRTDAERCCELDHRSQGMLWSTDSDREPRRAEVGSEWPPTLCVDRRN